MKKFLYCLIYFCLFSLLLVAGIFSYSAIKEASAVDVQTNDINVVNFYDVNNEDIIYSVNVPFGKTLNDIQNNNLLNNSYFSEDINFASPAINNQFYMNRYKSDNFFWSQTKDGFSFSSSVQWAGINYVFPFDKNLKSSYYFKVDARLVSGSSRLGIYTRYYDDQGNVINKSVELILNSLLNEEFQVFSLELPYIEGYSFCSVSLWHNSSDTSSLSTYEFKYMLLGSQNLDYFNIGYVNKLYQNSGGVVSNNSSWSLSETVNTNFDFNTKIYSDLKLFYFVPNTGLTYEYEGTFETGSFASGLAIKDVEAFIINGYYSISMRLLINNIDTFDTNHNLITIEVPSDLGVSLGTYNSNALVYNSISEYFDFNVAIFSPSFNAMTIEYYNNFGLYYLDVNFDTSKVSSSFSYIDIIFSTCELSLDDNGDLVYNYNSDYTYNTNYVYTDGLEVLVDMNSNTDFEYVLANNSNSIFDGHNNDNYLSYRVITGLLNNDPTYFWNWSVENIVNNTGSFDSTGINSKLTFNYKDSGGVLLDLTKEYKDLSIYDFFANLQGLYIIRESNQYYYNISEFYFVIEKPFYRVDNTLFIYNYDYMQTLVNTNYLDYVLMRNNDLYKITYNGIVPNEKFLNFYSSEILNTQFDRYISLYLNFNNNRLSLLSNYEFINYNVGFDFNFVYFTEPLVSNNGIYNYSFEKPGYVDMPFNFSLFHFYFPVLEVVENILIFLLFYCPIISDVISFLHFDMFFGGLLNIFNFIYSSAIGTFILSCLCFLIFWSLLKGLFPLFISSGRSYFNDFSDSVYVDYKDKKEYNRKRSKYKNDFNKKRR